MLDGIYIEQTAFLLNAFAQTVKTLGKMNLHDNNIHAENFFRDFLNTLHGWNLVNANELSMNEPGVDLVYADDKRMVQVSATSSPTKIQGSLDRADKRKYEGFHFYFLAIGEVSKNVKDKAYDLHDVFEFAPGKDIWDIDTLVVRMNAVDIGTKKSLYEMTRKHLAIYAEPARNQQSLSEVVKVLNEEMLHADDNQGHVSFLITEKIELNQLWSIKNSITESSEYTTMLNSVYDNNEQLGRYTRMTIHAALRKVYDENKGKYDAVELYRLISRYALDKVMESSNRPTDMMIESIEWCIDVIVADAFEACKIFEHPKNVS